MHLAADAPAGPVWVTIAVSVLVPILVAYIAARTPVWTEKAKARFGKPPGSPAVDAKPAPAISGPAPTATGETVLREWLSEKQRELKRERARADRAEDRVAELETENSELRRGRGGAP